MPIYTKLIKEKSFLYFLEHIKLFGKRKGLKFYFNKYKKNGLVKFTHWLIKHPIYLRAQTSDIATFDKIFLFSEYDMYYNIKPKFIIDCGANIGLGTVFFKNKYPNATIIAIEPDKSNFDILNMNIEKYDNVIALQGAVWHKKCQVYIDNPDIDKWGFTVNENPNNSIPINAYTINDIMQTYNIEEVDVLKIDIEGAELEVFSENYEAWLPKTKIIIIELHDFLRKGTGKAFFSSISQYDFSYFSKGENMICIRNDLHHLI